MIRKLSAVVVASLATLVVAAIAAPSATACSGSAHCWGIAVWYPSTSYTGGLAWLKATRLSVSAPAASMITNELWVVTGDSSANQWVEAGLYHGSLIDGSGNRRAFFWAERNSSGLYAEHFVQNISLDTTYYAKISHSGSGTWGIYLNGNSVGGSTYGHNTWTRNLQTGGETTTDNAQLTGTSINLQKRSIDGQTWTYDWGGFIQVNGGMQAGWGTYAKSMWSRFN